MLPRLTTSSLSNHALHKRLLAALTSGTSPTLLHPLHQHQVAPSTSLRLPPTYLLSCPHLDEYVAEAIRALDNTWTYEVYQVVATCVHNGEAWAKVSHFRDTSTRERRNLNITDPPDTAVYVPCDHQHLHGPRKCYNRAHAPGWALQPDNTAPLWDLDQPPDNSTLGHLCIGWARVSTLLRIDHLVNPAILTSVTHTNTIIPHHKPHHTPRLNFQILRIMGDSDDPICDLARETLQPQPSVGPTGPIRPFSPRPASLLPPHQWDPRLLLMWQSTSHPESTHLANRLHENTHTFSNPYCQGLTYVQ